MAEIITIAEYRKRKLEAAVAAWEEYITRAEQFQKDGKEMFANQMLDKAKAARKVIDKLRPPVPKQNNRPPSGQPSVAFTYNGRSTADLGWPKPPESA